MKFLGIDYGDKNVGLALSDDGGTMAFPKDTLLNTTSLIDDILTIITKEGVSTVVLGESKSFEGEDNPIMKRIHSFKEKLEEKNVTVHFQDELYSSKASERLPHRSGVNEQQFLPKNDARAATIILQSYLDKTKM